MNLEHEHPVSETLFRSLPKERRLTPEYQEKVQKYMDLQVNKKLLQEEILQETGKNVTLKDLSNIAAKGKNPASNFEEILNILQNVYQCSVSVLKDDDSTLQGIFFQDKEMKHMYKNYPEIMFFDGTYKLLNNNFTCYIFLIEDGNGSSEIVGVGLLAREDKKSVQWLIGSFKESNGEWHRTRTILTDKEFTERVVFTDLFPDSKLEICLFHTFKTFRREITPEKMGVSKEICDTAKEYLTKLAYCQSEETYSSLYESFKNVAPSTIMKYYNDNWHNIRKEWTYMCCANGNFLNTTNNRLESINGKLKSVIKKYSSFTSFLDSLFSIINCMRRERNHRTATAVLKTPSMQFPAESNEAEYKKILNPYPFEQLLKQLSLSADPKITSSDDSGNFTYEYQGISYNVNPVSCQCLWHKSMRLPCRHIFSVRRKLEITMFDPTLCDRRWLKSHFTSTHRVFNEDVEFPITFDETEKCNSIPKTTTARYNHIFSLIQRIAAVASESTGSDFLEKENSLKHLLHLWEKGQKVTVCAAAPEQNTGAATAIMDHNYGCQDVSEVEINSSGVVRETGTQVTGENEESVPSTSGIKLPRPLKRKGRPAGLTTTVIGLKKKKSNKPIPFARKMPRDRQNIILKCFVEENTASDAIHRGILIEEESIEADVEKVPSACIETCVNINEVKPYFTPDAWLLVQNVLTTKLRMMTWDCGSCRQDCGNENTILCDSCLQWNHYSCVGLLQPPKQKYWFCRRCSA